MQETIAHYEAGLGIRPSRRGGKVRGVARENVPGGGMELWSCVHDHAPGVRSCQNLTPAQRAEAEQCAADWLRGEITAERLHPLPVVTETEEEARQAASALVIEIPPGQDPADTLMRWARGHLDDQ